MKGTTVINKINPNRKYIKKRFDADSPFAGKFFFLVPYIGWTPQERFFYYKKTQGGYLVDGELYIVDEQQAKEMIKEVKAEIQTVEYRLEESLSL